MKKKKRFIIKPELIDTMREAKMLFVYEQMDRKEIAERTGISENTIGIWVKEFGWEKQYDISRAKLEILIDAKFLFLYGGNLTRKDIAAKVGVSTKTISEWAKKYKWNEKLKEHLTNNWQEITIPGFLAFIKRDNVRLYANVNAAFFRYCSTLLTP